MLGLFCRNVGHFLSLSVRLLEISENSPVIFSVGSQQVNAQVFLWN